MGIYASEAWLKMGEIDSVTTTIVLDFQVL